MPLIDIHAITLGTNGVPNTSSSGSRPRSPQRHSIECSTEVRCIEPPPRIEGKPRRDFARISQDP
jgi:hypothetical protein